MNAIGDELLALRQDLNLHHHAIRQIEFTRLNFAERVVDLVTEEYFRRFADAHQRGEAAALFEQVDDAIGEFLLWNIDVRRDYQATKHASAERSRVRRGDRRFRRVSAGALLPVNATGLLASVFQRLT